MKTKIEKLITKNIHYTDTNMVRRLLINVGIFYMQFSNFIKCNINNRC